MKDKINQNYFNLVSELIRSSVLPTSKEDIKKVNRKFADSRIIDLYVDCSDNFEKLKLKLEILKANK